MNNILVIYKKSTMEMLLDSADSHEQDYAKKPNLQRSHDEHYRTLDHLLTVLQRMEIPHTDCYRADRVVDIGKHDAIIAVGGDGTFLEASHYIADAPLLGVNSDPEHSTGFFCTADVNNVETIIKSWETVPRTFLHRLQLSIDGTIIPELVLNDVLVAHRNPAATTRYEMSGRRFKGSGLLLCTAAGSTGWMYQEGGSVMPLSSQQIQYVHRGVRDERFQFTDILSVTATATNTYVYIDGAHLRYPIQIGGTLTATRGLPLKVIGDIEYRQRAHG